MPAHVIPLYSKQRLLAKVRALISAPQTLLDDPDQSASLLFEAIKIADEELKLKIVLMLGTVARPIVLWPLYKLMHDLDENESVRHAAAVQLSVLGGLLDAGADLTPQLIEDLDHPDPFTRANAAFALGWEGNSEAAGRLIESLDDEDPDVQQAAVNALSNLRDDRLFELLVDYLKRGTRDQKRCILYNLYRFSSHRKEVVDLYRATILGKDSDLRYDALAVFDAVAHPGERLPLYAQTLNDPDSRIRELSLGRMACLKPEQLQPLLPEIQARIHDSESRVRRAAIRLIRHIKPLFEHNQQI